MPLIEGIGGIHMAKYKPRHAGGTYYQGKSSASKSPRASRYQDSMEYKFDENEIVPKNTAAQKTQPQTSEPSFTAKTVNTAQAPQAKQVQRPVSAPTQNVQKSAQSSQPKPQPQQRVAQHAAPSQPKPQQRVAQHAAPTQPKPQQRAAQHAAPTQPRAQQTERKNPQYSYSNPYQISPRQEVRPSGFALALRIIISTLAGLGIVFFLIPIVKNYFTVTSIIAIAFLALLIVHVNIKRILTNDGERRVLSVLWHVVSVVFLLCICWLGFITFQMVSVDTSEPDDNSTVIVLGAKVYQSGVSVALQNRLNTAITYLSKNPSTKVIVTGGQGSDEPWSEASAAKNYLVDQGIKEERILTEDKSTSTEENLSYSKTIMSENNLGNSIVLVTQSFHMFRASSQAKDLGYTVYCLPCKTNVWLLPTYYSREVLAITKYYITKLV